MTFQEADVTRNKILLLSFFVVVFLAGLGVIISNKSISFSDFLGSLKGLNPRVMSLIALPLLAVLFVLGAYLRKKNEERKWKQALLKTRAKKQNWRKPGKLQTERVQTGLYMCKRPAGKDEFWDSQYLQQLAI